MEEGTVARKNRHEEDDESMEDKDLEGKEFEDEDDDDDDDTIGLSEAEEEEEDDDDDEDEDENLLDESAEDLERKRLFQEEAEEILEGLTLEDVKDVLKERDMDPSLAPKLKKILVGVVEDGEATSMDEVWEEAIERLEE